MKRFYHLLMALAANIFYGFPTRRLTVVGVTGTDGKTTTCHLIYSFLQEAGYSVGLVTTIEARIGDRTYDTGFHTTSPDPWALQKYLQEMVRSGCKYAVLEVTSHALDQYRFWGVPFKVGVLTNVTREHLDYHRTFDRYLESKAKLFQQASLCVLNADDESIDRLKKVVLNRRNCSLITYGLNHNANVRAGEIKQTNIGQKIIIDGELYSTSLLGEYNVLNILAAIAVARSIEVSNHRIQQALSRFKTLPGRFELIDGQQPFRVIVDFAHTPNALEKMLRLCHDYVKEGEGRVIVVFGCAGLRDRGKRPLMGRIAVELADISIFTAEDPRTENVASIIQEMVEGAKEVGGAEKDNYYCEPNRKEAIRLALSLARSGDLVVITGKGHEKSMCFGTTEVPWSDQDTVLELLMEKT